VSRDPRSQTRLANTPRQPESPRGQRADKQWEQMVLELIACSHPSPSEPGRFDEVAIARYLSGRCSSEERLSVNAVTEIACRSANSVSPDGERLPTSRSSGDSLPVAATRRRLRHLHRGSRI